MRRDYAECAQNACKLRAYIWKYQFQHTQYEYMVYCSNGMLCCAKIFTSVVDFSHSLVRLLTRSLDGFLVSIFDICQITKALNLFQCWCSSSLLVAKSGEQTIVLQPEKNTTTLISIHNGIKKEREGGGRKKENIPQKPFHFVYYFSIFIIFCFVCSDGRIVIVAEGSLYCWPF